MFVCRVLPLPVHTHTHRHTPDGADGSRVSSAPAALLAPDAKMSRTAELVARLNLSSDEARSVQDSLGTALPPAAVVAGRGMPDLDKINYGQILSAASFGRVGELKRLVEAVPAAERANILSSVWSSEYSIIGAACAGGAMGALDLLLRYVGRDCLDLPAAATRRVTPLIIAAQRANEALTRELCDNGADPRRLDDDGQSAIDHARVNRAAASDPVWTGCFARCAETLERARRRRLRRQWQRKARIAAMLTAWQARAAERAYAPGGLGFAVANEEFCVAAQALTVD